MPGAAAGVPTVAVCEDACERVGACYQAASERCESACALAFGTRADLCGTGTACEGAEASKMVALYQADTELVTRLDAAGIVRVDHTLTAYANRAAATRKTGAAAATDRAEAAYHTMLAGLNHLTGRE